MAGRALNICVATTSHSATDDRLYFKEARSLAKQHRVTLVAPLGLSGPPPESENLTFVPLKCGPGKLSRLRAAIRLAFSIPRNEYDVIHLSDVETFPLALLLRWRCHSRVVLDIWEANYERLLGPSERPRFARRVLAASFRTVERFVAARCDLVITADAAIAESLGHRARPVVVFNYPILELLELDDTESAQMQKQYGHSRCLIYHGAMAEERGVLAAIEAMRHVGSAHPQAKLLLVGQVPEDLRIRVTDLVQQLDLGGAVELVGWVEHPEVGRYLAVSEIGLVPFARTRKFEKNIPQKIFEYWAVGMPLVATDLAPTRQFVERCNGGILTETNHPVVLAKAICKLLDCPEEARNMGLMGRSMVEAEWHWEVAESALLEAFERLDKQVG